MASSPDGCMPVFDNQGDAGYCTRYALGKAVTKACDDIGVDVNQEVISNILVNEHKDTEGKFATDFDGVKIIVIDTKKTNYEMNIIVKESSLVDFKVDWNRKCGAFVVSWKLPRDNHCVFAVQWIESGQKVKCLNSWGQDNPEPEIDPSDIRAYYRVSVILVGQKTGAIKQTNKNLTYPDVLTFSGTAARWGTLVWSCMGVYRKKSGLTQNDRPIWQRDGFNLFDNFYLFYADRGWWLIYNKHEGNTGYIKSKKQGLVHLPAEWKYSDGTAWQDDPSLTISTN